MKLMSDDDEGVDQVLAKLSSVNRRLNHSSVGSCGRTAADTPRTRATA